MNSKKVNRLFLYILYGHFIAVYILIKWGKYIDLNIAANGMVSDCIIFIPTLLMMMVHKCSFKEAFGFHKIRVSSIFVIVLFTLLIMPLATVCNAVSLFFVDNTVASLEGEIVSMPFIVMWLSIGVFGPLCEELVFRGMIFRGYKKSVSILTSILMSSLLFGLMHLNINQALYACVIGVCLSLLVEATGSLWGSVISHMFFNSEQVVMMYISSNAQEGLTEQIEETAATISDTGALFMILAVTIVIASVTTPLAGCVLAWLAKREGRADVMKQIWTGRKQHKDKLISAPLIMGVGIALIYMSLELILK